jgi:hypothetical protein
MCNSVELDGALRLPEGSKTTFDKDDKARLYC